MKQIVRTALLCFALALCLPLTALAVDGHAADPTEDAVAQGEVAPAPVAMTPADPEADPQPSWLQQPEWTTDPAETSFGFCPGPPVLSCQCGIGLGEPGSTACCYCNTCWDGYVLALCGLDP
ncbi:MAG: hypothetical protein AAGF23_10365 [Acidobacteriota bacterium]